MPIPSGMIGGQPAKCGAVNPLDQSQRCIKLAFPDGTHVGEGQSLHSWVEHPDPQLYNQRAFKIRGTPLPSVAEVKEVLAEYDAELDRLAPKRRDLPVELL